MRKYFFISMVLVSLFVFVPACSLLQASKPLSKSDKKLYDSLLYKQNEEGVREALEEGANPNNLNGYNPLYMALLDNQKEIVEILLENGADPNYLDRYKLTPLMHAAGAYNYSAVYKTGIIGLENCQMLVEHGVDINLIGRDGNTALDYAVLHGDEKIVDYLLENGAEIRPQTLDAARNGYGRAEYTRYGLQNTILKGLLATGKESGLDPVLEAAILGNVTKEADLIKDGKLKDKYKTEVLFNTAAFGDLDTLKLLENEGLSLTTLDDKGANLLQISAKYGQLKIVEYLIENGADIEKVTENTGNKDTALWMAVENNQYDVAKYLLEQGAEIFIEEGYRFEDAELTCAAANGNIEMIQLIESFSAPITDERIFFALHEAISQDQNNVLQYYIDQEMDVNLSDPMMSDTTMLYWCCLFGNFEAVKILVENGADVNKNHPITVAAEYGTPEIVAYLIEHGAEVNATGSGGNTALGNARHRGSLEIVKILVENGANIYEELLFYAIQEPSWRIVEYLIDQGANVNYQNEAGITPLIAAVSLGNQKGVELLLAADADTNLVDSDGQTALYYANKVGNQEIIKLLEDAQ